MLASTTVLIVVVAGIAVWTLVFGGAPPSTYRARGCQGSGWRSAFPDVPKSEIREFLSLFVSAFAFDETHKLKFDPTDRVLDIYRSIYPHKWMADALEVETFAKDFESKYGVAFAAAWCEEVTLGELFTHSRRRGAT